MKKKSKKEERIQVYVLKMKSERGKRLMIDWFFFYRHVNMS